MKKINFLIFILLFISGNAYSCEKGVMVEITSSNIIKLSEYGKVRSYQLNHKVEGHKTNCLKNRIFAWGTPLKFQNDSPQAHMWTLINVNTNKPIKIKSEGFGIFDISFSKNGMVGMVDYARGTYIVDVNNGRVVNEESDDFVAETCKY